LLTVEEQTQDFYIMHVTQNITSVDCPQRCSSRTAGGNESMGQPRNLL